ncbi:MAG TPA: YraN family protein [Clostridia bacterium]|nr:YraN family protein [Clostridia bacterium]
MNTKKVGDVGEEIAKEYLLAHGYKILEQNFVACGCEVDIICEDMNSTENSKRSFIAKIKNGFTNLFLRKKSRKKAGNEDKYSDKNENAIVFVEVKTRTNTEYGRPLEAVTKAKQLRYIKAAKSYIVSKRKVNVDIRFDVIEVLDREVTHIKSAFEVK